MTAKGTETFPRPSFRREVLGRIRSALRISSYLVPSDHAPPAQRPWLEEIGRALASPDTDPDRLRTRIRQLHASGRLDRTMMLSALAVVASSPACKDYPEAMRLTGQQELAALDAGGEWLDVHLASVARHRGVVCFLLGHDEVALDWFTRAMERQRSVENVGNVLAVLLRLGELEEARGLLAGMRDALPSETRAALDDRIATDDDLVRLR